MQRDDNVSLQANASSYLPIHDRCAYQSERNKSLVLAGSEPPCVQFCEDRLVFRRSKSQEHFNTNPFLEGQFFKLPIWYDTTPAPRTSKSCDGIDEKGIANTVCIVHFHEVALHNLKYLIDLANSRCSAVRDKQKSSR